MTPRWFALPVAALPVAANGVLQVWLYRKGFAGDIRVFVGYVLIDVALAVLGVWCYKRMRTPRAELLREIGEHLALPPERLDQRKAD